MSRLSSARHGLLVLWEHRHGSHGRVDWAIRSGDCLFPCQLHQFGPKRDTLPGRDLLDFAAKLRLSPTGHARLMTLPGRSASYERAGFRRA